ncbi:unnamed protein product [Tetraodon nigroviridis]|uniref:(spotted green pufferfish) hypothetical protein n=1 Tax=Tetraodon nigroviridis TaxID=99883 RepID=Q4RVQ1_TETNG|nr:unnamed protein product [Tetraodon nigroviridis]
MAYCLAAWCPHSAVSCPLVAVDDSLNSTFTPPPTRAFISINSAYTGICAPVAPDQGISFFIVHGGEGRVCSLSHQKDPAGERGGQGEGTDSSSSGRCRLWSRLPTETVFLRRQIRNPQRARETRCGFSQFSQSQKLQTKPYLWPNLARGMTEVTQGTAHALRAPTPTLPRQLTQTQRASRAQGGTDAM